MAFKRLEKLIKFLNAGSCNSGLFIVNANFKISLTHLSRLLNLGCTSFSTKFRAVICSFINFKICSSSNRMQCEALEHAL